MVKLYISVILCLLLYVQQSMTYTDFNVTLEGGYHNKGKVKIFNNDLCYENMTKTTADTLCRKMEYLSAIRYWPSSRYGPVLPYHFQCDENGTDSCHIQHNGSNCNEVVNLFCQNIKLVGSNNANEGRVELLYKGEQGLLCDDSFNKYSADAICRQLGYRKSLNYSVASAAISKYGFHNSTYILDDLVCPELASDINECRHTNWRSHNCGGQYETVGVECFSESPISQTIESDGSVRIEVNNIDYYLQHPSLSVYDANALCIQNGFLTFSEIKSRAAGKNDTLIYHQFNCSLNMRNLNQCTSIIPNKLRFIDYYFEPEQIEQVNCTNKFEIRKLTNDVTQIKGMGEWNNICYDGMNEATAASLCRHMDYRYVRNYLGVGPAYNNNYVHFQCSGLSDLRNCSMNFNYPCHYSLNLTCSNNVGLLQIVNGYHNKGLVKVGTNSICLDSFTKITADKICQNLGYIDAIRFWGNRAFVPSVKVRCHNSHSRLDHCYFDYNTTCFSGQSVNVFCQNLRLAGGNDTEGRVEVIYRNQVGQLCDDAFGIASANTVCKQLGFKKAISFSAHGTAYSRYGSHNNRFILDDLNCASTYDDINLCSHNSWFNHNCGSGEVTGVQCLGSNYCKNHTASINFGSFTSSFNLYIYPIPSSIVRIIPDGASKWCTGIFIDELWVLTSASCFLLNTNMYTVYINHYSGTRNFTVYKHSNYSDQTGDNNLALLKVVHNYNIIPMCISNDFSTQALHTIKYNGSNQSMFVGWTQYNLFSQKIDLFPMSECARRTGLEFSRLENLFCGPVNSTSNFFGQSGGPLFGRFGNDLLLGITNKAIKAARPFNNMIFTNLYKYKSWIDSIINNY